MALNTTNLTPASDYSVFSGAVDLDETVRDEIRAILARTKAPGIFTYELPGPYDEDDEQDLDDYEAYRDGSYWDIVYRDGDLFDRRQVEYDDEIGWGYRNLPQAAIDTLAEVLDYLQARGDIEEISY
jgi:hypothetical protein